MSHTITIMFGSSYKARLRRNGCSLASRRNAADGPKHNRNVVAHPKGAPQKRQLGVAALAKGTTIGGARRLDLPLLGGSESASKSDALH